MPLYRLVVGLLQTKLRRGGWFGVGAGNSLLLGKCVGINTYLYLAGYIYQILIFILVIQFLTHVHVFHILSSP